MKKIFPPLYYIPEWCIDETVGVEEEVTDSARHTMPIFALHPLCGSILADEPDPLNPAELCKSESGETALPDGGFRLLKIGSSSK